MLTAALHFPAQLLFTGRDAEQLGAHHKSVLALAIAAVIIHEAVDEVARVMREVSNRRHAEQDALVQEEEGGAICWVDFVAQQPAAVDGGGDFDIVPIALVTADGKSGDPVEELLHTQVRHRLTGHHKEEQGPDPFEGNDSAESYSRQETFRFVEAISPDTSEVRP